MNGFPKSQCSHQAIFWLPLGFNVCFENELLQYHHVSKIIEISLYRVVIVKIISFYIYGIDDKKFFSFNITVNFVWERDGERQWELESKNKIGLRTMLNNFLSYDHLFYWPNKVNLIDLILFGQCIKTATL